MANKTLNLKQIKEKKEQEKLSIEVIELKENESIKIRFNFRHLSTNEILSLSRRDLFSYKTNIKKSIKEILNSDEKYKINKPFSQFNLNCIVGTARGRDLDSFGLTIKPFIDSLQGFYIEDDSHKHMKSLHFSQIIGQGFFIIFEITPFN